MKVITSRENSTYKKTAKLLRKKSRDESGQFLLEGTKPLRDALDMGLMIEKIFACYGKEPEDWIPRDRCVFLERELFRSLSDTVHSQGIIAVVRRPGIGEEEFMRQASGPLIVLDQLQDPGNAGTIVRTAEAAGFSGIVATEGTVDLYSPKVVRAAAGSLLRTPVLTDMDAGKLISLLREHDRSMVVTALEHAQDCFEVELPSRAALVIGNEGRGVSPRLLEAADLRVRIPMSGRIESLNAAVAAGILMYQLREGRREHPEHS